LCQESDVKLRFSGAAGQFFWLAVFELSKIVELAKKMIELSSFRLGEDIEIKFTGLKPEEKLFEEL
jgi:FlaA1/EpsC-like NDP-sugar epimerase